MPTFWTWDTIRTINTGDTICTCVQKKLGKKVNVQTECENECSCCLEQSYLFDRIDINHVGVDEGGQVKNMTRVCRLRSVFGMEECTCVWFSVWYVVTVCVHEG